MLISTLPTASASKKSAGAELSPAIARELRSSFGQEAVLSPADPRISTLHGYYSLGWESVGILPDPPKTLGRSWSELPGSNFEQRSYALDGDGSVRQVVSFSLADQETRITSIHNVSMIETRHETLIIGADGKVRKDEMTAV